MKKLLSIALVIIVVILALPTAALASPASTPFNFENLLTDECEATAHINSKDLTGIVKEGIWFATEDSSSLKGILSMTTLNDVPVFVLDNPTVWTYTTLATQTSEFDKTIDFALIRGNKWFSGMRDSISTPLQSTSGFTMGYTSDGWVCTSGSVNTIGMYLYINSDHVVYPAIVAYYDNNSHTEPIWNEYWPKNNEELTAGLRKELGTTDYYTFYTGSSGTTTSHKHKNLLYHPLTATAGEGGSITEPGEKLFRPGDISQKYTVAANEGYTIYYIQVDGKTVSNSINCGDTATFDFDAIYGPRSINAVFKKK